MINSNLRATIVSGWSTINAVNYWSVKKQKGRKTRETNTSVKINTSVEVDKELFDCMTNCEEDTLDQSKESSRSTN